MKVSDLKRVKEVLSLKEISYEDFSNSIDILNFFSKFLRKNEKNYRTGKPTIKDKDFDSILKIYNSCFELLNDCEIPEEIKLLEKFNPIQIQPKKLEHVSKNFLGTLKKCNDLKELMEWYDKIVSTLKEPVDIIGELKYDGSSISAVFNEGKMISVFSRGKDGKGENLTSLFEGLKLPKSLSKTKKTEIKIEACVTDVDFEALNNLENIERTYANNRSASSALLSGVKKENGSEMVKKFISLIPLDIMLDDRILVKQEKEDFIKELVTNQKEGDFKFLIFEVFKNHSGLSNHRWIDIFVKDLYNLFNQGKRFSYPLMIDGLVFKVQDLDQINKLGYDNEGSPNWAVALKFEYISKETKIEDILLYYGKTGRISPVVRYAPIKFYGAVQTKTSISYKRFKELNLSKGDTVLITYRNDVLSYIENITKKSSNPPIKIKMTCPICEKKLTESDSKNLLFCKNEECKGNILGKIEILL